MIQYERCAELYRRFRCSRAVVDASGIGDPIVEEFRERQMTVEPFIFTPASKRALIEGLVVACDKRSITIPNTPAFEFYRHELEAMEYEFSGASEVRYGVSSGRYIRPSRLRLRALVERTSARREVAGRV